MEHAVHLAAGHFIRDVAPTSARALLKKVKRVMSNVGVDEALDLDRLEDDLMDFNNDEAEDAGDDEDFDVGDSMGKALALVTQASLTSTH
jgi:hypothetical protein